jgi:hypothetical protein
MLTRFAPRPAGTRDHEKATRCGRARRRPPLPRDAVAADPCGLRRRERWNGTGDGTRPRVSGGAVGDVDRKGASEQIARAARVVAGVATPCRSGSVLRFRQANRCVPVCRWCARLEPLAWAPACPKQEPRKTMAVARFTDSCWCATE